MKNMGRKYKIDSGASIANPITSNEEPPKAMDTPIKRKIKKVKPKLSIEVVVETGNGNRYGHAKIIVSDRELKNKYREEYQSYIMQIVQQMHESVKGEPMNILNEGIFLKEDIKCIYLEIETVNPEGDNPNDQE